MSNRSLWLAWAMLALAVMPCQGGQDPGVADTVRVECPFRQVFEPDSMAIPIYVWNDETLKGFSLGFRITTSCFRLSSWKVTDNDIPPIKQSNLIVSYNADSNTVLLGWVDLFGANPVAATTTSKGRRLVTLYLRCSPSSPVSVFRIDSTFLPPAGTFALVSTGGLGFAPQFVDCEILMDGVDEGSAAGSSLIVATLKQNTPNPFNASTAITFDVPRPSSVKLDIINVLGENLATLIDGAMSRGQHKVVWDGTDKFGNAQPSGVYFYRLSVGTLVQTRKMVLLK